MQIKEQFKQIVRFLNPFDAFGGKLGHVVAPLIVTATMATQIIPGTPLNLSGITEIGGGAAEPGAELVLGVDLSYDETTIGWWQYLYDDGVRIGAQALLAVPYGGPEVPVNACNNLRNMLETKVLPAGYIVVSDWLPGAASIDAGYAACPDVWSQLLFVAIDIELPLTNPQQQILDAIARVRELGQSPVIYTSWWAWTTYVGYWAPPGVPLWNAYWDDSPDVDYLKLPFGFVVLVGEQYRGSDPDGDDVCNDWGGVCVDLNVFHAGLLQSGFNSS